MAGQRARAGERHQARGHHGRFFDDPRRRTGSIAPEKAGPLNLRQVRDETERAAVIRAVSRVNGNLSKAAELLGVSRPTLYDLIHRFGLKGGRACTPEGEG